MRPAFPVMIAFLLTTTACYAQDSPSLGETARKLRAEMNRPTKTAPVSRTAKQDDSTSDVKIGNGLNSDAASDISAIEKYKAAIAELLHEEKFDDLEQIAAEARLNKTRFSGGVWKLYIFYQALRTPPPGQVNWNVHLEKLERWKWQKPYSITAQVALAGAYTAYGYEARGENSADTVTEQGWELLASRVAIARAILADAAKLKAKCPQWYVVMQDVILAEKGDRAEEAATFREAIAFEPLYYYYYRRHALFLLPKWYGEDGEAEQFADEISKKAGDREGDIIYFEIASEMVHQCTCVTQLRRMSWERIQKGHAAMEERYGVSLVKVNQFTRMAVAMADAMVAEKAFIQIGDNWDPDTWRSKEFFDQSREWAKNISAYDKWMTGITSSAEANGQTPEGRQYDAKIARDFQEKFAVPTRQCVDAAGTDLGGFDMFMRVGKEGIVEQLLATPTTAVSNCLVPKLYHAAFAPPPKPDYWIKISMHVAP
jgi:hypothetical protein